MFFGDFLIYDTLVTDKLIFIPLFTTIYIIDLEVTDNPYTLILFVYHNYDNFEFIIIYDLCTVVHS